jgi:hypothetical protein
MNTLKTCFAAAISMFAIHQALAQVRETAPSSGNAVAPTRYYNSATSATGSILKKDIRWDSPIPLNKTYAELTDEQKAALHKMYEKLGPNDEPPFPVEGIKPIFNAVKKAQRILQSRGRLDMKVTVGPDGKAIKVEDFGTVRTGQMTETAQQVLLLTTYKPASCDGTPCTMQFRFTQQLGGG